MTSETTFRTPADANLYAGAFSLGGMFFGISSKDAKLAAHLTVDQGRELVAKLQKAIAEHDLIAKAKAEARVEAA